MYICICICICILLYSIEFYCILYYVTAFSRCCILIYESCVLLCCVFLLRFIVYDFKYILMYVTACAFLNCDFVVVYIIAS